MSEISYINTYSDKNIMKDIGTFVRQKRIAKNLTQQELADQAAMSRSTLSLMERGENIVLLNLIKVLRILDVLYVFEKFHLEPQISPILLAKEEAKRRKRVRTGKNADPSNYDLGW